MSTLEWQRARYGYKAWGGTRWVLVERTANRRWNVFITNELPVNSVPLRTLREAKDLAASTLQLA